MGKTLAYRIGKSRTGRKMWGFSEPLRQLDERQGQVILSSHVALKTPRASDSIDIAIDVPNKIIDYRLYISC